MPTASPPDLLQYLQFNRHRLMTDLQSRLLSLAEAYAAESFGCDLERLDPEELEWYLQQVTEANLEDMAEDLSTAAWQAY